MKSIKIIIFITIIFSVNLFAKTLILGTTTSLDDTGFLSEVAKEFKNSSGIEIKWIAKGTGEALELGKRGDVDLLFVHDPEREKQFIKDGYGKKRHPIMYNYFILATSDDFNLKDFPRDINEIMKKISEENIVFISRGDGSGTHSKEKALWNSLGITPKFKNYREVGTGMAKTLNIASELRGITLSDNGTFYSVEKKFHLKEVPTEPNEILKNIYSILELKGVEKDKQNMINQLIEFLKSPQGKKIISNFGKDKFGKSLFFKNYTIE